MLMTLEIYFLNRNRDDKNVRMLFCQIKQPHEYKCRLKQNKALSSGLIWRSPVN